jgi:hypothetical protein
MTNQKTIYDAISEVQSKVGALSKDSRNPHFKSDFVSLAHLLETLAAPLRDAGLVLTTAVRIGRDSGPYLEARLTMTGLTDKVERGEAIVSEYPLPVTDNPQKFAAATTYARRYAVMCLLALPASDDDGEGLMGRGDSSIRVAPGTKSALEALRARTEG